MDQLDKAILAYLDEQISRKERFIAFREKELDEVKAELQEMLILRNNLLQMRTE